MLSIRPWLSREHLRNMEYPVPPSTIMLVGEFSLWAKNVLRSYLNSSKELKLVNFLSGVSSLGYSHIVKEVINKVLMHLSQVVGGNNFVVDPKTSHFVIQRH